MKKRRHVFSMKTLITLHAKKDEWTEEQILLFLLKNKTGRISKTELILTASTAFWEGRVYPVFRRKEKALQRAFYRLIKDEAITYIKYKEVYLTKEGEKH